MDPAGIIRPGLMRAILDQYTLPRDGAHGIAHWGRVLENGLRIGDDTGADLVVVSLFSVFHDACRVNEGWDHGHGRRGAQLAADLRGVAYDIDDDAFDLLFHACAHHTDGRTDGDATVRSCWDADRLDLGRVHIAPDPSRMATRYAARPEVIEWAEGRSRGGHVPAVVRAWEAWVEPEGTGGASRT
jgi:uncharacterized protein